MRNGYRREWLCLLVALGACKRTPVPSVAVTDASTEAAIRKTVAAATRPSEKTQILKLLWKWVAAQSNGDFAQYRTLYSADFQVVDRAHKRPRTVKGATWLKRQRRLFSKVQTVATRDEKAQVAGDHGEVRFFKTMDSGTYHEEGERLLVLQRGSEGWQITREEILSNKVDPSRGTGMEEMAYALVWEDDVVLVDDVSDGWIAGQPRLRDSENGVAVAKVDESTLPVSVLSWKRERLRLIDASLEECEATVTGFEAIAHSEWDMATIRGETGDSDRKTAAKVWEAKHLLVARLSDQEGPCSRPLLARPARLPRGKLYTFERVSDAMETTGTDLFNDLPDVAKLTADVKSESPDWDEPPHVFLAHAGKAGFFLSAQNLGPASCGEPGFYADALWHSPRGRAKGNWELLLEPEANKARSYEFIFDDGTGKLRFVYTGDLRMGVLVWEDGRFVLGQELEVPYLDCRC
jgi:ketosteroid isomerase-like protein